MAFLSSLRQPTKATAKEAEATHTATDRQKPQNPSGMHGHVNIGTISATAAVMRTFRYTSRTYRPMSSPIIFLSMKRRTKKHICEIIMATTTVTSGAAPIFRQTYETGTTG